MVRTETVAAVVHPQKVSYNYVPVVAHHCGPGGSSNVGSSVKNTVTLVRMCCIILQKSYMYA